MQGPTGFSGVHTLRNKGHSLGAMMPVSYTHLDVYKRQVYFVPPSCVSVSSHTMAATPKNITSGLLYLSLIHILSRGRGGPRCMSMPIERED